jgi:MFS family permease
MGIGLVDPILPALSKQLKASPSSVELLFTSYLVVTAVAMLVTGWVSSRIGGKRTLVAGLILIVAGSAAAGASHTIGEIIGFRAGWGLGNALFIATSLAVIIGAASGGFAGAIILYETAMHLGIHELGYVFTGWGVLVAIFAVFVAPRAQRRFGTPASLYVNLALLAADLVVIAAFTSSQVTLIVAVIVSGAFVGLNNTLTTQAVMLVAPVERPVASAAYGFVRFIGGGLAPYCAARLAADLNVHVPFYLGAVTVALAIVVLATGHGQLARAEQGLSGQTLAAPAPGERRLPAARPS